MSRSPSFGGRSSSSPHRGGAVAAPPALLRGGASAGSSLVQTTTCTNCGNVFMADANFCRLCGHKRERSGVNCPDCGNTYMADSSFCRHCGRARQDLTPLGDEDGVAQSLDDLCDQIRQLRATVLPEGLRHAAFQGDTPERTWETSVSPTAHKSSRALSTHSRHSPQQTATHSPTLAFEPVTRSYGQSSPPRESSRVASSRSGHAKNQPDAIKKLRLTLWEERVLLRCILAWRRSARSELASEAMDGTMRSTASGFSPEFSRLATTQPQAPVLEPEFARRSTVHSPPSLEPELARRGSISPSGLSLEPELARRAAVHPRPAGLEAELARQQAIQPRAAGLEPALARIRDCCWRAWHRQTAAWKAREIEGSVQLLDSQVERRVRSGFAHWFRWANHAPGRNDRRRFRPCIARMALRRWRQNLGKGAKWRDLDNQASALLRIRLLRWALSRLVERVPERVAVKRAIARFSKQRAVFAQTSALRRLKERVGRARQYVFSQDVAVMHAQDQVRRTCLRRWASWCRRRRQRRSLLQGHLRGRAWPRRYRRTFQAWVSHVREELRHHATLHKARIVLDLSLKSRALRGWVFCVQSSAKAAEVLKGFSGGLDISFQVLLLKHWRQAVDLAKRERSALTCLVAGTTRLLCLGAFARLHEFMLAVRHAESQHASAMGLRSQLLCREMLRLWRRAARTERHERTETMRASGHRAQVEARGIFHRWIAAVNAEKSDRHKWGQASSQSTAQLARRAWIRWVAHARARIHRRRLLEPRRRALAQGTSAARRRNCLASWARALATRQRRRLQGSQLRARALRAFAAWRDRQQRDRLCVQRVQAMQLRLRRADVCAGWSRLRHARQHHIAWEARALPSKILRAWRLHTEKVLDLMAAQLAEGIWRRQQNLVRSAVLLWCQAVLIGYDQRVRAAGLLDAIAAAAEAHGERQKSLSLRMLWHNVEVGRAGDVVRHLYDCFHGWHRSCAELRNKRSVHLLCETYRKTRITRKALLGWHALIRRISDVSNAVLLWVASRATQFVQEIVLRWLDWARRRRSSIKAAVLVRERRCAARLRSWRLVMLHRLAVAGVMDAVLAQRARLWLKTWQQCAKKKILKRRKDEVKTEILRSSRRRWVFDRWCSAGRWTRLCGVAEAWDGQVLCKALVRTAFTGWSAVMGRYAVAERAAGRIGELRASRLLHHWSFLLRVGLMPLKHLKKHAMAAWKKARKHGLDFERGLRRLGELGTRPSFGQWKAYLEDRKKRRRRVDDHGKTLEASYKRREQKSALRWWGHSHRELHRERRLELKNGEADAEKDAQNEAAVKSLRMRRICDCWHQELLWKRAKAWQDSKTRLFMEITGQATARIWLATMASANLKKKRLARAQERVQKLVLQNTRVRVFDEWAKAFQHESVSTFAEQLMKRWWTNRIFDRWRKHNRFHQGFVCHLDEVFSMKGKERLEHCMKHWVNRIQIRRKADTLWLEGQKSWTHLVFDSWSEIVDKSTAQRQALRHLKAAAKFSRGSKAAGNKRSASDAKLQSAAFFAYAAWVRRARDLQKCTADFAANIALGRCRRRLCAWVLQCRATHYSSTCALDAFSAWVAQARRSRALRWASGSFVSWQAARGCGGKLRRWRAWTLLRRSFRSQLSRHLSILASWVLRAWGAALRPIHQAAQLASRRTAWQLRKWLWAWRQRAAADGKARKQGEKLRGRVTVTRASQAAIAWMAWGRKRAATRRLTAVLDNADRRWLSEAEWTCRANADAGLRAMFHRFAQAFDQRRGHSAARTRRSSLAREGAFEALVSLIWARQQLSVSMGRLRGYDQPWLLGSWPHGRLPLLEPCDPYYGQAEIRLAAMVTELESQHAQEQAPSLKKLMNGDEHRGHPPAWQRVIMWQALADLLVVHHPGWPSAGEPGGGPSFEAARLAMPQEPVTKASMLAQTPCFGSPTEDKTCPKCNNLYMPDAEFCRRCGHSRFPEKPAAVFQGRGAASGAARAALLPTSWASAPELDARIRQAASHLQIAVGGDAAGGGPLPLPWDEEEDSGDSTPSFGHHSFGTGDQAAGFAHVG
eukprot:TRINITY_DN582_c0_g3_i1.p1 TRINITY_DN582_c0_g3~~TRINITY_DN582_c0_g3_i1.p1  ORF type:complete len:2046 (+),score=284.29 TRINITY_DN582_c0_g3_i1:86-6223(+)